MTEMLFVLSLFVVLVWAIVRVVLVVVRHDAPEAVPAARVDPIATYVEENYGSHFVDDPISVKPASRRR